MEYCIVIFLQQELVAHGLERPKRYGDDLPDLPRDVEIDGPGRDEPDGMTRVDVPRDDYDFVDGPNNDMKEGGDDDPLQCPHCFRGFNITEVEKFMQHTTTCLENN